ncbi:GNAT family N-acetyltransferase [Lederbergia panacisoli]|uniref:GNAT family N-acetyltransferase n=1 Tax=Lederbergia panacisoli TaxID=1255251 RepID=UPI00214B66E2|nr:GNAT family N-acetyltransferase [Lederbergia panacisoli]MCR2821733.1 GNAT family N-acetyltransferase [Lederbergia panacisoli]
MSNKYIIREATESDALQILKHTKKVFNENPNVTAITIDEFNSTVDEEKEWINSHNTQGLLLVAEVNRNIIGMLSFRLSPWKRLSHQGIFEISVQEKFANKGIGTSLIKGLLAWARAVQRIEKISLEVFSNNDRAIQLYKKLGFIEEGRLKNHVKLGSNEYVDDILMSKFIVSS